MERMIVINDLNPWFFSGIFFIFGAIVGSFLNVCIIRIPQNKSLVFPSSQNADGDSIAWYDKIPIFSWFILCGKDRKTGKSFSFRYPLVEGLTAILFFFTLGHLSSSSGSLLDGVFCNNVGLRFYRSRSFFYSRSLFHWGNVARNGSFSFSARVA